LWLAHGAAYDGDLDDYRRDVLDSRAGGSGGNGGAARKVSLLATAQDRRREAAGRRQQTAPCAKKIKDAETLIGTLQKEIHRLDVKLGDSGLYSRNSTEAPSSPRRALRPFVRWLS